MILPSTCLTKFLNDPPPSLSWPFLIECICSCSFWQLKVSIMVGIVGLPNVGKSSLINSMKRSHVVNVGATPGLTRSMQEIQLDKKVKLLDCPGVVMLKSVKAMHQ